MNNNLLSDLRLLVEQESLWDDGVLITEPSQPVRVNPAPVAAAPVVSPQPSAPSTSRQAMLESIYEQYKDCTRCPLGATRIKFVFGVGSPDAKVMFIGEGPGYEEDRRGEPFVGKAGQLLDKIMAAIGLNRQNAYIANIVKCHPMQNPETPEARGNDRPPSALETETCSPILKKQIAAILPQVIVTLGSPSTRTLLQTTEGITKVRGQFFPFPVEAHYPGRSGPLLEPDASSIAVDIDTATRAALQSVRILPTYHPAALLRNPDLKKDVWADMKLLRDTLQKSVF